MIPKTWLGRVLLGAIVAVALAVRLRGITFGLPLVTARPDELVIVATVLRFFSQGSLNPHFFDYPGLFLYIVATIYGGYLPSPAGRWDGLRAFRISWAARTGGGRCSTFSTALRARCSAHSPRWRYTASVGCSSMRRPRFCPHSSSRWHSCTSATRTTGPPMLRRLSSPYGRWWHWCGCTSTAAARTRSRQQCSPAWPWAPGTTHCSSWHQWSRSKRCSRGVSGTIGAPLFAEATCRSCSSSWA